LSIFRSSPALGLVERMTVRSGGNALAGLRNGSGGGASTGAGSSLAADLRWTAPGRTDSISRQRSTVSHA